MIPIKHLFHINSPVEEVFSAINDIDSLRAWYTTKVEGGKHLSDRITFTYGQMKMDIQITDLLTNKRIQWTCIEKDSPFEHHVFTFDLDSSDLLWSASVKTLLSDAASTAALISALV